MEYIPWSGSGERFWEWLSENRSRAIVLGILIVVPIVAWQYSLSAGARRHMDGYAKIQELGGIVGWDQANQVYGVNLSGAAIGDEEMELLASFEEFSGFNLDHTNVTDAGLAHF